MVPLLLLVAAAEVPLLDVQLSSTGSVTFAMNGITWLHGDEVSVCDSGRCYAKYAAAATDKLESAPPRTSSGTDTLGSFSEMTIAWAPAGADPLFETSLRTYGGGDLYVFVQRWPRGCSNCSSAVNDANDVISAFPTLRHDHQTAATRVQLNFLNWGGNQLTDSTYGRWNLARASEMNSNRSAKYPPPPIYVEGKCNFTYKGKCPLDFPYFNGTWVGGAQHGAPLVVYDENMNVLVASPLENMLVSQHVISRRLQRDLSDRTTLPWAAGLGGLITDLPAGFTHKTIVVAGRGVRSSLRRWGDKLLAVGGKIRPSWDRKDDLVLSHIGYWTDRGSYYYGHPGSTHPDWSMEKVLKATQSMLSAQGLPIAYYQLDDWWFQQTKGDFGGMKEWRPCHQTINGSSSYCSVPKKAGSLRPVSVFPSGAVNFLKGNPPLVLYMGLISNTTVYAKQNGGDYDFEIDGAFALPTTIDFYRDLFANATRDAPAGLGASRIVMFEQDFLSYWMDGAGAGPWRYTLASATAGAAFLKQQNDAAIEHNVSLQYCMNLPCTVLQSTQLQAVSNAREAKDHVRDPLVYSWKEGLSGLLLDSVGLGASIDNIFTSGTDEEGCAGQFNCTDMNPRYETALAALSGGPYAIGDGMGYTNTAMVMHACRADGAILRTTEQMAMLDAGLREGFRDLAEFDVWSAATVIGEDRWTYLLSTFLPRGIELTPLDLGYSANTSLIAWDKWSSLDAPSTYNRYGGQLRSVNASTPLRLRACPHLANPRDKNWIYTVVAPILANGWAFIGEMNKVASVSGVRFTVVEADSKGSIRVVGVGVAGEMLILGAVAPSMLTANVTVSVVSVTVKADGSFTNTWHSR